MPKHLRVRSLTWFLVLALALTMGLVPACSDDDDPTAPADDPSLPADGIHVDDGYVGLVIDTRPIFRKGYLPFDVVLTFADHGAYDATLQVDAVTNLAVMSHDTDDLTADDLAAFDAGVSVTLTVRNADGDELATHQEASLVLDNSNRPLILDTTLPWILPPLDLRADLPYLIQREGYTGILSGTSEVIVPDAAYLEGSTAQQFMFVPVEGEDGTFYLQNPGQPDTPWCLVYDMEYWLRVETPGLHPAVRLVPEQDDDGWVRLRLADSDDYLDYRENVIGAGNVLAITDGDPGRFRLISDHIDWDVVDRGTVFNQPIMPPVQLDFAYRSTLTNCSSSTLEESVGRAEQRRTTTLVRTTESLQLFDSATLSAELTVGYSITAKVGLDIEGVGEAGEEISHSASLAVGGSYTTSSTTSTQNVWQESTWITTDVSRVRTITVPPYSAVEVYDAVKTIDDVLVPFTQVLRIAGVNKDTDQPLTGEELQTQMLFNFVEGVIVAVGDDYVDLGLRGEASIDKVMNASTNVSELEGACD